jgi:Glycoside Hydrolase Family 113
VLLSLLFVSIFGFSSRGPDPPLERRVAIVLPEGWQLPGLEHWTGYARREGIEIRVAGESDVFGSDWEVARLAAPPVSAAFRSRLARYPVTLEPSGFVFDGRAYREAGDGIALSDPDRGRETLVLGNSRDAAARLVRWVFWNERRIPGEFRAISGELSKEGRFRRARSGALEIDRTSGRDRIADRERFFSALANERRDSVVWRFRESERPSFERWRPVLERFLAASRSRPALTVFLYPDPAAKALYMGSSRPADVAWEGNRGRVDVDTSAPPEPDLVSPVLAAAAIGSSEPALRAKRTLLAAAGARAYGRWWGRDVPSFASFLERAGVHPNVAEVVADGDRNDVSPICAVGAAASWLDVGFREGGDAAIRRAFAAGEAGLTVALTRWRRAALAQPVSAPRRRATPPRFLRGVSYAMTNSVEGSYASPRSLETLRRLSSMAVNSISIMPYGFSFRESVPEIGFVHNSPRGETDEGTLRAVADARSLGMTAMVKPQLWIGGGAFVGAIAMTTPTDWAKWFAAYRRFAIHHAIVAEASGAALFCIGTELGATEAREKEWRETIAAVRLATGATLLYATNWAARAPNVRFWDALDAIGADFYDPLSVDSAASDAALVEGVRRAAQPVAKLSASTGKPVIFAEAGYPPARSAWIAPHDEESGRPFAPEDAARSVRAVFAGLTGQTWWKGVYWWKAFSDGRDAGASDRSFNFLGRPAGEAIASGFRRMAATEGGTR